MLVRSHWKALLQHCIDRRAYAGCRAPAEAGRYARGWAEGEEGAFDDEEGADGFEAFLSEHLLGAGGMPAISAEVTRSLSLSLSFSRPLSLSLFLSPALSLSFSRALSLFCRGYCASQRVGESEIVLERESMFVFACGCVCVREVKERRSVLLRA